MATPFSEEKFKVKLDKGLEYVRSILDPQRHPCNSAELAKHAYEDKFFLAEFLTNTAFASQVNSFLQLGLNLDNVKQLREWASGHKVSLRFRSDEICVFDRSETKEANGSAAEASSAPGPQAVTEYIYTFEACYELLAVRGPGEAAEDQIRLRKRRGTHEIKTLKRVTPRPEARRPAAAFDIDISWLFGNLDEASLNPCFEINREHAKCHTPRRNPKVDTAMAHFRAFSSWATQVVAYLFQLFAVNPNHGMDTGAMSSENIFVPVMPVFFDEKKDGDAKSSLTDAVKDTAAAAHAVVFLPMTEDLPEITVRNHSCANFLLAEERKTLWEKHGELAHAIPNSEGLLTPAEAAIVATFKHCSDVCKQYGESIEYIEELLRKKLIQAIGKQVTPTDFWDFMDFHNQRLLDNRYCPAQFHYAIRRSMEHSPEGTISLEQVIGGRKPAAVQTHVAHGAGDDLFKFRLNPGASVMVSGQWHVHAWLRQSFPEQGDPVIQLAARAQRFGSMIVMAGQCFASGEVLPQHAFIARSRDELLLPLELSCHADHKEFKDAVQALSPEQKQFATHVRCMQLENTSFAVLIIPTKPQLEKVLRLPEDSLTQEPDLVDQIIDYIVQLQIPTDVIGYHGNPDASEEVKVNAVRERVQRITTRLAKVEPKEDTPADPPEPEQMNPEEALPEVKVLSRARAEQVLHSALKVADRMQMDQPSVGPTTSAGTLPRSTPGLQRGRSGPTTSPKAVAGNTAPPVESEDRTTSTENLENKDDAPKNFDCTSFGTELERCCEVMEHGGCLKPQLLKISSPWKKKAETSFFGGMVKSELDVEVQQQEKEATFHLLTAITRGGVLPIDQATLHVIVTCVHGFEKSLMHTLVQDSTNPIQKMEGSSLIMAGVAHKQPHNKIIKEEHIDAVRAASPWLFAEGAATSAK